MDEFILAEASPPTQGAGVEAVERWKIKNRSNPFSVQEAKKYAAKTEKKFFTMIKQTMDRITKSANENGDK